jgi:hypothetical protein
MPFYPGGFDTAHAAARLGSFCLFEFVLICSFVVDKRVEMVKFGSSRAYDRAAIKFRGLEADINFSLGDYEDDLKQVIVA